MLTIRQNNAVINEFYVEEEQSVESINQKSDTAIGQYFPYGINEIIAEIVDASFHESDYDEQDDEEGEIKRIKQSNCMFVLVIIASLITAMENLYIFLGEWIYRDLIFVPPSVIFRLVVLPLSTYKLCQNWNVIVRLFFMVDKVLLAAILEYIGVMSFIIIFLPYTPLYILYYALTVLYPIIWFLYIGNFRVLIIYCDWSKWQVLTYKLTLLLGSTSYFILGVHYLVGNLRFTRGLAPQLDEKIENILLIYINAGFQVFLEMLARMDGIDGIGGFRNDYKLHCDPEDMEMLLKGREKIQKLRTLRSIKSRSSMNERFLDDEVLSKSPSIFLNVQDFNQSEESVIGKPATSRLIERIKTRLLTKRSKMGVSKDPNNRKEEEE